MLSQVIIILLPFMDSMRTLHLCGNVLGKVLSSNSTIMLARVCVIGHLCSFLPTCWGHHACGTLWKVPEIAEERQDKSGARTAACRRTVSQAGVCLWWSGFFHKTLCLWWSGFLPKTLCHWWSGFLPKTHLISGEEAWAVLSAVKCCHHFYLVPTVKMRLRVKPEMENDDVHMLVGIVG